jgi:integrase
MRLTDITVKRLPAPAHGNKITYDDKVKGFGARVTAAASRSFVLTYRRKSDGRQRRITIGSFPDWSTTAAREEAKRLKREVDAGADPIGEQEASRTAPTVAELCARFEQNHIPRLAASTQRVYRQQIAADILPAIGHMKVAIISHADIDALHRQITARSAETHANRVIGVISKMFNLAIKWGWRTDNLNPAHGIERNRETKRTRYLSSAELIRLSAALEKLRNKSAADAVRLLLLTGARRGELLGARWTDFDLEAGVWTKPAPTTKSGKKSGREHRIPLSDAARQLLVEMRARAKNSEWLFPSRVGGPRLDLDDTWERLRRTANIPDTRMHDLRHTYASILVSAGLGLPVIGALLGHTQPATTARYAHLYDDPLRVATERASAIITGKRSADVVPLKRGAS